MWLCSKAIARATAIVFIANLHLIAGQQIPEEPTPSLADTLTLSINPPNEALNAFFPPSILNVQTPLAIRYALFFAVVQYELFAACDATALSFFGRKDSIPNRFCSDRDTRSVIQAHMTYRLLDSEFPIDAKSPEQFLSRLGLNPLNRSTDTSTPLGWANVVANRFIQYFVTDNWNSQGDLSKTDFRQQYQDYTGYSPVNPSHVRPRDLQFPLRWQPLTGAVDRRGLFGSQVHVVPQIGVRGKPLALSREEFEQRQAPPLYHTPNRRRSLSRKDRVLARNLLRKLFQRSANLTEDKISLGFFWENKFISLGIFALYYQNLLGISDDVMAPLFLAEMMAQHDAALVAWKEKRRNDNVRPVTLVRRLLTGTRVHAWKGLKDGVGIVKAEEWEPVVPIQPHSEYPSASAVICTASLENLRIYLDTVVLKGNETIPPFEFDVVPGFAPNSPIQRTTKVVFSTPEEAARSCGESRLDSGVHFEPSVPAGHRLGKGIGKAAFAHVMELVQGRVPKNCERCFDY